MGEISNQDAFFPNFVFCSTKNLLRFQQSIQNQAFPMGSENDNNDLTQKGQISKFGKKIFCISF